MRRKNIGYIRVSTNEQAKEGYSCTEQTSKILALADRNGDKIDEFISDEGYSGSNLKRKGIQKLLKMISKNEVAKVYVWIPSRLSRDILQSTSLTRVFSKYNVDVVCYSGNWLSLDEKARDPESGFNESIIRLVDQLEIERTRIRTVHGMIGSAKMGNYPIGGRRAPIGYNKVKNGKGYRLEIDPQYTQSILHIFSSIVDKHMTLIEIAHELNKLKWTDEKWNDEKLSKLVNNPIYCGWFKRDWYEQENHSPAFITKEYWELTQKVLTKRKRPKRYTYLFKGRVFCEHCGDALVCIPTKKINTTGQEKIYLYYVCKKCNKRITEDIIYESVIVAYQKEIQGKDEFDKIKHTEKRINNVLRALDILVDDFTNGYVSDEYFDLLRKRAYDKLKQYKDDLNRQIKNQCNCFKSKSKEEQEYILSSLITAITVDFVLKKVTKVVLKGEIPLENEQK